MITILKLPYSKIPLFWFIKRFLAMMEKRIDLKAAFHDSFQGWRHRQKSRESSRCGRRAPAPLRRGRSPRAGQQRALAGPARSRQVRLPRAQPLDPRHAKSKSCFHFLSLRAQLQKNRTKPHTAWLSATEKLVLPPQQNSRAMLTSGVNLEVNKNFPRAETK